jgi:hypothetical protein
MTGQGEQGTEVLGSCGLESGLALGGLLIDSSLCDDGHGEEIGSESTLTDLLGISRHIQCTV